MQSVIYLKYTGLEGNGNTEIDLSILGESLVGFDAIIKDYVKISGINCDVDVKATKIEKGSIVFHILLDCLINNPYLFSDPATYIDFLKFIGQYQEPAANAIKSLGELHTTMNDLVAKYPLDFAALGLFVKIMFNKFPKIKNNKIEVLGEHKIPKRYIEKIEKIKHKKIYKKALKPFVEDAVVGIEVDTKPVFDNAVKITRDNFADYLTEDERILPDLINGQRISVKGRVIGLLTGYSDYLKIKIYDFEKKFNNVVAIPGGESRTDDFIQFYNKDVIMDLEVFRFSLYQKPKFIIHGMNYLQKNIEFKK